MLSSVMTTPKGAGDRGPVQAPGVLPVAGTEHADSSPGGAHRAAEVASLRPFVTAVVARVLRSDLAGAPSSDVDDCAQEVLRRALEGASRLRAGEPLRPWLAGIARHVATDTLRVRRTQRRRNVTADDGNAPQGDGLAGSPQLVDPAPGVFDHVASRQSMERVERALATLPEGPRQALLLFHGEGLAYGAIAERLGVPLGTVATWVLRGRNAMATALSRGANEGEGS